MKRTPYHFPLFLLSLFLLQLFVNTAIAQTPACLGERGKLKWLLWENIRDNELDYLTHLHSFPNNPDTYENILAIKSPGVVNQVDGQSYFSAYYGTYYGSLIRGFIFVPQSGNYTFNITGDDQCRFFLSTNDTRENLQLQASVSEWTYREEYAKASELNQTSTAINLQTGQYYYFEVWQKEHSGGDHVEVKWKTPSNNIDWQGIADTSFYDYACAFDCPPSGTPCDDGNVNTTNDRQDGFCNCVGTPTTISSCVGKQGEIKAFYYLDLPGNSLSSLFNADKYPLMPDTVEILEVLSGPLIRRDTYGTRISGLLKVPVTGDYQFNVTASDRNYFKLSTTESPDDAVDVAYINWASTYQHYRYPEQTSALITLNKDNFYYFEMNHREGSGSDYYHVFWRTPFMGDTLWRHIDKAYIYGYNCEMACIPEGTPCDDGNNFTKNDEYDANCNCVGIPCRGDDCDETPALTYTPTEACGVSEKVDTSLSNVWESCTPSANPNSSRGVSHWIQYDLGQTYLLNETHIWNYNGAGAVGKGFKEVVIDYSADGTMWLQLGGIYQWGQAPGTIGYTGFIGPDFNGITARYILITALNNWDNGACSGFSKITINATDCLLMGQVCDDGDANSVNDRYDANCNCIGEGVGLDPCGQMELTHGNIILSNNEYRASARIISAGIINGGSDVKLMAGESVQLLPGFHAKANSTFLAAIVNCAPAALQQEEVSEISRISANNETLSRKDRFVKNSLLDTEIVDVGKTNLKIWPNPTKSWTTLSFNLPNSTIISLCIYSTDGKKVICLANNQAFEEGIYTKEFPAQRLKQGMYFVVLNTEKEVLTKPLVVIRGY